MQTTTGESERHPPRINMQTAQASLQIEAELSAASARVQRVRYDFHQPPASVLRVDDTIRVELCLNSRHRSARACFVDHWSSSHYERIGELFVLPPTVDMAACSDEQRTLSSVVCQLEVPPVLALFDRLPGMDTRFLLLGLDVCDANVRKRARSDAQRAQQANADGFVAADPASRRGESEKSR
jgi:AraC family transcriptional regulator